MQVEVTAKSNGHKFEVSIESAKKTSDEFYTVLRCNGMVVSLETRSGNNVLVFGVYHFDKWEAMLNKAFNTKLKKSDACVTLTPESWEAAFSAIAEIRTKWEQERAQFVSECDLLERIYIMHDFLDYGDYRITQERSIQVWRKPHADETNEKYFVIQYDVNSHIEEWEQECKIDGNIEVSKEAAQKWIERSIEWNKERLRIESEKAAIQAEKEKAKADERAAKFSEAKEKNIPVILSSYFIHGDDIPKKYRDSDSDMGSITTYAMPNGTVKEEFNHAY